jgi:hypothetical protein
MPLDFETPGYQKIVERLRGYQIEQGYFMYGRVLARLIDQAVGHLTYSPRGQFGPRLSSEVEDLSSSPPRALEYADEILATAWDRRDDYIDWRTSRDSQAG